MIKIIRYSDDGFNPKKQTHHIDIIENQIENFDIAVYPKHLHSYILEFHLSKIETYKKYKHLLQSGIWAFIENSKNKIYFNLNHLARIPKIHFAYISKETNVFDCNLEFYLPITDNRLLIDGCFIPEQELSKIQLF